MTVDRDRYGPWAVIAGGSEGVGAALARRLADAGVNLVLVARKPGPLHDLADSVRRSGVLVRPLAVDLLASDAIAAVRDATAGLDVGLLVINAGANTHRGEFVESDPAGAQRVVDLNITVRLALCHHFGAQLKARGRGGILLIGSLAGYVGHAGIGVYAAAKAFGRIFAEGLWLELQPHGVDVLELVLGLTDTPAMRRAGLRLVDADDADAVAAEGLAHLGTGPVRVTAGNLAAATARSALDRAAVVRDNAGRRYRT
ncbi:SDR family NAD(P)-dependent oxidoreductase [Lentzea albidocapillata]|uniref:Short-chain dehydrogenase n=1 Tax=Lentzea albidocapillata TaxID=40571 RepID=A0A1W2DFG4_9PSEU|nr:SDR family NAD(P)-dependent oxidoreductase [Lentzea albidocapillata]SMC96193.1 hypothetical protein SAMN05660733_02967 [Lentzea albidocapillata]